MPKFAAGVVHFQNAVYPEKKEMFEALSHGQSPEALFITCSDSRIETAMITQTDPGELFICRNAGNIVPPHTNETGGMTASIEYAIAALEIKHIVVCGHTECGAMQGAMHPEDIGALPHTKEWLGHARAAVDIAKELCPDGTEEEVMRIVLQQNVLLQMQHLRTHPAVAVALAKHQLQLHGWVYDIKTGAVDVYEEETGAFTPASQRYAETVIRRSKEFAARAEGK